MRSNGESAIAIGGRVIVTFGDDCPGPCTDGIAVHQAVIPMVDEGGDVILPQYYALCCDCHRAQYIQRYGFEHLLPCGCDDVPLQEQARRARRETALKAEFNERAAQEWRAQFMRDHDMPKPWGELVTTMIE